MSDKLANVHPILAKKALQIINLAKAAGFELVVTQGFRSFAEQDALYKKIPQVTKARGGSSYHNYGLAVDFAFVIDGKICWPDNLFFHIGEWAKEVGGLAWGGDWKHFKDLPHVQFAGMPSNASGFMNLFKLKGLQAIWNQFNNVK